MEQWVVWVQIWSKFLFFRFLILGRLLSWTITLSFWPRNDADGQAKLPPGCWPHRRETFLTRGGSDLEARPRSARARQSSVPKAVVRVVWGFVVWGFAPFFVSETLIDSFRSFFQNFQLSDGRNRILLEKSCSKMVSTPKFSKSHTTKPHIKALRCSRVVLSRRQQPPKLGAQRLRVCLNSDSKLFIFQHIKQILKNLPQHLNSLRQFLQNLLDILENWTVSNQMWSKVLILGLLIVVFCLLEICCYFV